MKKACNKGTMPCPTFLASEKALETNSLYFDFKKKYNPDSTNVL